MTTILITGVNGYIGSKIAKCLLKKNQEIIGIDLNSTNIKYLNNTPNFRYFRADITDSKSFPHELKQVNILIHCAALVHKRSKDISRENYFRINYEGLKNISSFLNKEKLKQIIFLSTVSVYGKLAQELMPDENSALVPNDFYGESKLAAENEIREFSAINDIPYTILRLTPVYGEDFLLNIRKRVYLPKKTAFYKIGSGKQNISLCSVHNVIDVLTESIANHKHFYKTYILKDCKNYSLNEIITVLKKVSNQHYKPIIWIPLFLVDAIFKFIALILPRKGKYYNYQLKKVTQDSVYSGDKLFSSGTRLKWNLTKTLSENR